VWHSLWFRITLAVVVGAGAASAAYLSLRAPIEHRIATQAAQHAFGHEKLNILLLGYQDDEETTDTVILAHLDVDRRLATLVSIPRDTWVPIPGQGSQKINAAYAYGGGKSTAAVVSKLLGRVPVDATIALQPEGAAQIVDALGGLNANVDEDMDYDDNYGQLHIHLKKGEQYLTGSQVVGYVRFRHDAASDYGRMRRQQQILRLMMDQASQPQNWAKLPRIIRLARKDVTTTLSDRQLVALLEIFRNVPDENVRFFTLPSKAGWVGDVSVVFADPRWAKAIVSILFTKTEPPQDEVRVANATGDATVDKTVVAALRGAGWNVPAFVDQPARPASVTLGASSAARLLALTFATPVRAAKTTTLLLGTDWAPDTE
jgi:LCP family protein required for cell wall assembly